MCPEPDAREQRRSTRVRLKVTLEARGLNEHLTCEGETTVVNLHGALILRCTARGDENLVSCLFYGQTCRREVVYVDPDHPRLCGIKLEKPENIWGISLPPDDWDNGEAAP